MSTDSPADFSPATRRWFDQTFGSATSAQAEAWAAISAGENALVVAPTGSGKTLAAFLWALDRLTHSPRPSDPIKRCRVLYVSPLKALAYDVERNLRQPLAGITQTAQRMGTTVPDVSVAMRTGDTPPDQRRAFARAPSDILITTPESLFLLLTSQARRALSGIETVIVDEVHAVSGTKRGAHLALSLERLDELLPTPAQRVGLSATVRPIEATADFLGGNRPVTVVQPAITKSVEVSVEVMVEDLADLDEVDEHGQPSVWPSITRRLVDLIEAHRSTIVFVNSRLLAERLCARVNELAGGVALPDRAEGAQMMAQSAVAAGAPRVLARAHHGSMSREERLVVESGLKSGELRAVVATSSLELGIDMGAVELVVQIGAPPSASAGLQRVGRAGHQVGAVSRGVMLPTHRSDLLAAAVTTERMSRRELEAMRPPRNPVDVLSQQVVAMVSMEDWSVDRLATVVRRAAPFAELSDTAFFAVLDMLSGRYPSTGFSGLRPKLVWDRAARRLSARPGAQRIAVQNAGTIPDRGLYGVFLTGGGRGSRVGELDEEMVYESRVGDVFILGATSWRIDEITPDRVLVSPAPGRAARMPFWKGDDIGRPAELGRAIGERIRTMDEQWGLSTGLNPAAAGNLAGYVTAQRRHSGITVDDRTVVMERFRDELGDWRLVIHCVLGARVNRPWALAIAARLRDRYGIDGHLMAADDGIVARLPDMPEPPDASLIRFDAEEIHHLITDELPASALFAGRFRECAARALLLPRRAVQRRQPLWQQRQRAGQLFAVARGFEDFPITAEAARECLEEYFDMPELSGLMAALTRETIRIEQVVAESPSPFATSLMSAYVAANLYGEDQPLAERRVAALNSGLLDSLLGEDQRLLDADLVAEAERWLQWLDDRVLAGPEDVAELLRVLGDVSDAELVARGLTPDAARELAVEGRAVTITVAGQDRWVGVEDAGRYRHGIGAEIPAEVPEDLLSAPPRPLDDLIARYARTHGPFTAEACSRRFGVPESEVTAALHRLDADGVVDHGRFLAAGPDRQWCAVDVLRLLRRKTIAALRAEIAPVPPTKYASFLAGWQGIGGKATGADAIADVMERLQGTLIPASAWENLILAARVEDYSPAWLDELTASGELLWAGSGALPSNDGHLCFAFADSASLLLPQPDDSVLVDEVHHRLLAVLDRARFFRDVADDLTDLADDDQILAALWDLVWAGWVSNDTLAPVRGRLAGPTSSRSTRPGSRAPRFGSRRVARRANPLAAGRWYRLPPVETDPTQRALAATSSLLDRHGVVVSGAPAGHASGFAGLYPVLSAMESRGSLRRGYFVNGLGAAQFADPTAVDRLRSQPAAGAVVMAAVDPANPFGSGLPWPTGSGHRPGRRAGALVVICDGDLAWFIERGGKTMLSFTTDPATIRAAATALEQARRRLPKLMVEQVNGEPVIGTDIGNALTDVGFRITPKGLRLD
ncbi:Lhr family ATP dependent helicase [Stackebrandtia endophytica]|uniref:Lhr family ATP dependent helicase n=1 Tax=Stackebrandtia endophytica TaxID=1496996 RepID=A0A543B2T0_9ACTN|nr:DEAD/DEAH box helicase [Stackebrandtia endophytica]TQL79122.1 Lhr family ATP dependent helicase [Stackebrandtia endophytica]